MTVADESCEKVKNIYVLVPERSDVEYSVEGMRRALGLETSTCNDLPAQDEIWTIICSECVHFSNGQNRFLSLSLKRDVPVSLADNFLHGKRKLSTDSMDEDQFCHLSFFS